MPPPRQTEKIHISWMTVTYRSVALTILALFLVAGAVVHFAFPETSKASVDKVGDWIDKVTKKWGQGGDAKSTSSGEQQAHFTNIDGTVRVKKTSSNSWVAADYGLPLEKGDIVKTDSEGIAKIVFADGSNYTVKQDSLIVVEENSTNAAQQTQVAVQVTTGTVDLTTAAYTQGSKSQVTVAGAVATLAPQSAAQVRNDPRADQSEILLTKGSGQVARAGEVVSLGSYEKVSFKAGSKQMTKVKEIGPPTLITPANMMPMFAAGGRATVLFSWTPVDNVRGYHVRVSRNPYFSSTVLDREVQATELRVSGVGEGAYYWVVQAIDAQGKESIESEKNRFTIIPKGNQDVALPLELDQFIQHGRVIEVGGKTDPTARVMVNGEEVPAIGADGVFHYFTPPLPSGENVITITAQNARGGVNTQTKRVIIQ